MTEILQAPSANAIRDELKRLVLLDLLGPAGGPEEEIDEQRVRDRYLVGMLAPKGWQEAPEPPDELAVGGADSDQEGPTDVSALPAPMLFPSSFGLTFAVDSETAALKVTVRWGQYARVESETIIDEKTGAPRLVWKRTPVEHTWDELALKDGTIGPVRISTETGEVLLKGLTRRTEGERLVSLFLVNEQTEPKKLKDSAWLFQPEIVVEGLDGAAVFAKRSAGGLRGPSPVYEDPDEQAMKMIYRNHVEFAVGHGVSVHAETAENDPRRAIRLSTTFAPSYEVPQQTPPTVEDIPDLAGLVLDMKELSETETADFSSKLAALPDAYEKWIHEKRSMVQDPDDSPAQFVGVAEDSLDNCEHTLQRIREGIDLVTSHEQAADAFRFANKAMWLQRIRSIYSERNRRARNPKLEDIDTPANRTWYPFQIAFILLNLPGVTDVHHPDRTDESDAIADLLWFPTGGGKTEAYLGLAAYTMGVRRLQGEVAGRSGMHGLTVLMRYTLRLLTLQQFQRASALICACEVIRQEAWNNGDTRWGDDPFRIGLWVGQRTTPNRTEDSAEAIKRDHNHWTGGTSAAGSGTPAQLTYCPWCGSPIDPGRDISVETFKQGRCRTFIYCSDKTFQCPFTRKNSGGEGLPVLVVDEEIYRRLPSLLIATVDKFAQMPWKGETQMLMGMVNGYCERHGFRSPEIEDTDSHPNKGDLPQARTVECGPLRPPDLIIQDELHLISGPLGTLVGVYETAVDELCSWEVDGTKVRPKIIASTATIRRADMQVHSLFLRKVNVFPPHGIHVSDNFFSVQREPGEDYPGRCYLGICAPGVRLKAALIRVYIALLSAGQTLFEKYGEAVDPWMTTVGYFNSLRELGGMIRLVEDDVRSRLRKMEKRGLARRSISPSEELTSRIGSKDIPRILDHLEVRFQPEADESRKRSRGRDRGGRSSRPIDVLLSTSMISVGVDVQRLGLMVVAGQPKATAEYIQATSRVGRKKPGLVVTVYNWARPRDMSHYETFEHYHATFYKHVEALSVTPFSSRALDRGLSALLVSLVRLTGEEFNSNEEAGRLERHHEIVSRAVEAIAERAEQVLGSKKVGDDLKKQLEWRLDNWLKEIQTLKGAGSSLAYRSRKPGTAKALLQRPGPVPWQLYTCLNSLREVEPTVALILQD